MHFTEIAGRPRELEAYTGRPEQLFGIRLAELTDGRERGVRIADVRSGGGLRLTVLLDRGLDLGDAEFRGVPLAYLCPGAFGAPAYFDERGLGWLRNWGGGLLTSCGLRNVGAPGEVDGETFPLHGRLSNLPARELRTGTAESAAGPVLYVEGTLDECRLFGEKLELRRRIGVPVGGDTVLIEDTVRNRGFRPEPVFLLYHTNWGYPLVHEDSRLDAPPHPVEARDAVAQPGLAAWADMQPPTPGFQEQVFYHQLPAGPDGFAALRLRSPRAGLCAEVAWRTRELPLCVQWKMMGQGEYVTGIEPANCRVAGRAAELAGEPHCVLAPGEARTFALRLRITPLA
jgi:hypothetical protein